MRANTNSCSPTITDDQIGKIVNETFTRYPFTSAASTLAPFCKSTSAAAIAPCTAAQCKAVCCIFSVALTSPPCFNNTTTNIYPNSTTKQSSAIKNMLHQLQNKLNQSYSQQCNRRIQVLHQVETELTSIMYWARSGKLLRAAQWSA